MIEIYGDSAQAGKVKGNEDTAYWFLGPELKTFFMVVADGASNPQGGDFASRVAVESAKATLHARLGSISKSNLKDILNEMLRMAGEEVVKKAKTMPELSRMGTTFTCVLGHGAAYVVGNIGDSRVYKIHKGKCEQITIDHSVPNTSFLTKSFSGGKPNNEPDIFPKSEKYFNLRHGDGLVVCSDGILPGKESVLGPVFANHFKGKFNPYKSVNALMRWAIGQGSVDNISIIIARRESWYKKFLGLPLLVLVVIFAVILGGIGTKYMSKIQLPDRLAGGAAISEVTQDTLLADAKEEVVVQDDNVKEPLKIQLLSKPFATCFQEKLEWSVSGLSSSDQEPVDLMLELRAKSINQFKEIKLKNNQRELPLEQLGIEYEKILKAKDAEWGLLAKYPNGETIESSPKFQKLLLERD